MTKKLRKIRLQYGGGKELTIPPESHIVKHFSFLNHLHQLLKQGDNKRAQKLIQQATHGEMCALCELAQNALQGTLPVSPKVLRRKLGPVKDIVRSLANTKNSVGKKRKEFVKLIQHGGLPILPILAPIISSLLGSAIASQLG